MGYQPSAQKHSAVALQPITGIDDLKTYFQDGAKPASMVKIGMEVEKHGIHKSTRKPVTYLEQNGFQKIQTKLMDELDWKVERQEGKYITDMSRGGSHLMMEFSEGTSELSGRTHPSIHNLARELRIHQHEISEMSRVFDTIWLGIGYQPFALNSEIRTAPLERYKIVSSTLKRHAVEFAKICSVQANIDYISEDDMRKKFQLLLRLSPFLMAMYANSPLKEGKLTGLVSYRTQILRSFDRRRYGIRKIFFDPHFSFRKWTEFCLGVPMRTIFREGKWIPVKRLTFRQFLKSGYEGFAPAMEDFILHVSFIYTDVRMKSYLELRTVDSLPPYLIPSMQAIVKAFVYHPDGEKALKALTKDWTFRDFSTISTPIAKHGLYAEWRGKKLLDYAKEILNVASSNLHALAKTEKHEDECDFLRPIKDFVFVQERSPGRFVADMWDGEWKHDPERLITWCSFE